MIIIFVAETQFDILVHDVTPLISEPQYDRL